MLWNESIPRPWKVPCLDVVLSHEPNPPASPICHLTQIRLIFQFTKANKKRQTTLTLPAAGTSAQDMLKENKATSTTNGSTSSSQQLTKSQSFSQGPKILGTKMKPMGKVQAFGKKDVNLMNLSKKKKVLCEASTSSSSTVGVVNQIPRKKIKVSNLNIIKGEATSSSTTSESQLTKYFLTSSKTLDEEMIPCCSKYQSNLKAPSSPSGSSNGSNAGSQVKITSFLPIKKMTKSRKLKFGSRPRLGAKGLKKLDDDESQSNASAPSSKLLKKKKRSLKSLKKPLLH
jgi:hypothetical protein